MHHRDNKKHRGKHTTCTDLTAQVVDLASALRCVSGFSLGIIQQGKGVAGGSRKVKFGNMNGCILLTVRQSRSVQTVRIFAPDIQVAKLDMAKALRKERIPISFR